MDLWYRNRPLYQLSHNHFPTENVLCPQRMDREGGSPRQVVMGDDSCSRGRGFKSRHRKLDGHFLHLFVVEIVLCVWKRPKINEKEAGVGPL